MKIYQCLKCGQTFKTRRQVIAHLKYVEKISEFTLEYYFQSFSVKEVNGVV
jgi:hypothetical protein